jgi:hypothetical protein
MFGEIGIFHILTPVKNIIESGRWDYFNVGLGILQQTNHTLDCNLFMGTVKCLWSARVNERKQGDDAAVRTPLPQPVHRRPVDNPARMPTVLFNPVGVTMTDFWRCYHGIPRSVKDTLLQKNREINMITTTEPILSVLY